MNTEKIERYINHEMDEVERISFELEMKNNPDLANDVEQMQALVEQLKLVALSAKIKRAQSLNKRSSQIKLYSIIGLVCLALFSVVYFLFTKSDMSASHPDLQKQIATDTTQIKQIPKADSISIKKDSAAIKSESKAKKPELPMAVIKSAFETQKAKELAMNAYFVPRELEYVRGKSVESVLDSARLAFNNEQYVTALNYLNSISEKSNKLDYFKAHIYFNLGQFEKAEKLFNNLLIIEKSHAKRDELEWYQLLNSLECGSKCKVKSDIIFSRIAQNPEHAYFKPATNLKNKLEKQ